MVLRDIKQKDNFDNINNFNNINNNYKETINLNKTFDLIIVGAGPAGFWAAYEIASFNKKNPENKINVLLLEKGKDIYSRSSKEVMTGFGGAGTFSDGKLHYTPVLSHEKLLHLYDIYEYQNIIDYIYNVLKEFGVNTPLYPRDLKKAEQLVNDCKKHNIELFIRKTQHVGSDKLPQIIKKFYEFLINNNITVFCETEVKDIIIEEKEDKTGDKEQLVVKGVITNKGNFYSNKIFLAPGRVGTLWLQKILQKNNIPFEFGKVEVGVRVEFPNIILKRYSDELYETVFKVYTPTYDDVVRTFCPCPNGYVAMEHYDNFICVNGHSLSTHDSPNSNFALVVEVNLTEPVEDSNIYAKSIAYLASVIGGGKPIVQRLGDLKKGRRSTYNRLKKSLVKNTLKEAIPGDIAMALPARIVTNLIEAIKILDNVLKGLNSDSTLLYAPEIKLRSTKVKTDKNLMTSIEGLFVGGDAAGLSGNIIGAMATGYIVGKKIVLDQRKRLRIKSSI